MAGVCEAGCRPPIRLDRITDEVVARLDVDDPRRDSVAGLVDEAADRLLRVPVRSFVSVLIERDVRRILAHPDSVARGRWRRRTPCELRMEKWDGSPGRRVPLRPVRNDGWGRWYVWPAGEPMLPRSGPPQTYAEPFVYLVPHAGSWIARWGDDGTVDLYCDVTTAPVASADTVRAVDLDLDVVRYRSGGTALVDRDDFERRRVAMSYPADVVAAALATARWLHDAVRHRTEPFGAVGDDLLRRVRPA